MSWPTTTRSEDYLIKSGMNFTSAIGYAMAMWMHSWAGMFGICAVMIYNVVQHVYWRNRE